MPFRLFQYPLPAPPELDDLNAYLDSHRIAAVSHHLASGPLGPMLVFVVQTVAGGGRRPGKTEKIDYREVLNAEDFARFSRLREIRKQAAEAEGVPAYAVFTNAQLAEMVQKRCRSLADLEQIEGVGKARVERHGAGILETLAGEGTA
ncbi:MAG: HRDC domain-containing protein [Verrucomicrobiales bacterium]|nr:HRDC domain-containing protein [Verrucomicrobiales bacterium]